jgi:hypothetical protein
MDGTIARKRHKPEEILAKSRLVDVLTGQDQLPQGQSHSGRKGWWAQPITATHAAQYE